MLAAERIERDTLRAQLAAERGAAQAALASTRAERLAERAASAAQYRHAMHLYELEKRRVKLDDCLQYVARAGHTRDAASALGACKDYWLNDVQMHWAVVKARPGEHKMTRLMWACEKGRLPRVRELIAWTSDVNAVDALGWAPLHFACDKGHLEVARELLARGARIKAKTKKGSTALHLASLEGHAAIVRLLLDAGAQIEAKNNKDATPLSCVSQSGHLEVVRLLLERGAVVDARIVTGSTSLMIASSKGRAAVVRELLARGADVNARDNDGHAALHWASIFGRAETMRELLKRADPDINAQDGTGDTPLIDACMRGHLMAATLLIGHGADLALLNNAGRSALFSAEWRVRQDALAPAAPPAAGVAPPRGVVTEAQRAEHKVIVALLKARGAA